EPGDGEAPEDGGRDRALFEGPHVLRRRERPEPPETEAGSLGRPAVDVEVRERGPRRAIVMGDHMKRLVFAFVGMLLLVIQPLAAAQDGKDLPGLAADAELTETRTEVPRLASAAPYAPKANVVEIELSQYAGYAGLVVANGGLEPNEGSVFFKKHGFKLKITLSEEESWSSLNAGRLAA